MELKKIQKNTGTPIESIISAFENVVMGKYNASRVQHTQNPSIITENVYEILGKGAIVARFAQGSARVNMIVNNRPLAFADGFIMYLGFDESAPEYESMISDVIQALDGK